MRHRIFIAINLPEDIKKKLFDYQSRWPELPCQWTKKENLHITLEFLSYLTDEELIELCQKTREIASKKKSFSIHLNKICYDPPASQAFNKKLPRMIWVTSERIKEFNFSPHITLGRIKTWQFRQIKPKERPKIDEETNLSFEVNSIEVMESALKRTGSNYTILESYPLKS
jgi:2'-5' RNA ligase